MLKSSVNGTTLVAGLIITILISSAISMVAFTQLGGLRGPIGPAGPQGETGQTGPQGATGPAGPQGETGAQGPMGVQGPEGPIGPQGERGPYAPDFDSGWINIMDAAGQFIDITHNLLSVDVIVNVFGKVDMDEPAHNRYFGLTNYVSGWDQVYGGIEGDLGYGVVQTDDGGYAVAGHTSSYGAGSMWLIKTDVDGVALWNRTYGEGFGEYGFCVAQTFDGGYIIAGFTESYGMGNMMLVKTDGAGNPQWERNYGGSSGDYGFCVAQTHDGGYAVGGYTESYGVGGADFWLVKTDADGNMQWNKTYGGTGDDFGYAMVKTADEGFAMVGSTESYGVGLADIWLVKTGEDGDIEWNVTYGGANNDVAYSVIQNSDGGFAIAGYTNSFDSGIYFDAWLIRTDVSGTIQWDQLYGGPNNDYGRCAISTIDGGYMMVGYTESFGAGAQDVWLIKTDSKGNKQMERTFGGVNDERGRFVVQTGDGAYVVVAYTESFGSGGSDALLIKIGVEGEVGLTWTGLTEDTITIYRGRNDVYWNYVWVRIWKID